MGLGPAGPMGGRDARQTAGGTPALSCRLPAITFLLTIFLSRG